MIGFMIGRMVSFYYNNILWNDKYPASMVLISGVLSLWGNFLTARNMMSGERERTKAFCVFSLYKRDIRGII